MLILYGIISLQILYRNLYKWLKIEMLINARVRDCPYKQIMMMAANFPPIIIPYRNNL